MSPAIPQRTSRPPGPDGHYRLAIVIPARDELERLPATLADIAATDIAGVVIERMVVVDSASSDGTGELAMAIGRARDLPLDVVRCERPGKGAALKAGLAAVAAVSDELDGVLLMDADNATPLIELRRFGELQAFEPAGGDRVYIGSRFASGATVVPLRRRRPLVRRLLSGGLRWLGSGTIDLPVADAQCGFKLVPAHRLGELVSPEADDGWLFDLDLLGAASEAGIEIVEVPVRWFEVPGSHVRPVRDGFASLLGLMGVASRHRPLRLARISRMPVGVLAIFAVALPAYLDRLLPGVGFWDTAIFQAAPPTLSLTHPTGYPLYTLLGYAFSALLPVSPAVALNVFSALTAAAAVAGMYWIARRLGGAVLISAAMALLVGVSLDFLRTATRADAHTLHALLMVILLALAIEWRHAAASRHRLLVAGAFVFGLSLANHLLTIMLAPALLALVLVTDARSLTRPRTILAAAGAMLLGASVYLYLPIRAAMGPPIELDSPPVSWDAFWRYATGADFHGSMGFLSWAGVTKAAERLPGFAASLADGVGPIALAVAAASLAAGLIWLARTDWRLALFSSMAAGVPLYAALTYENAHLERYFFTSLIICGAIAALGATAVLRAIGRHGSLLRAGTALAAALMLLMPYHAYAANQERVPDWSADCFARELLERVAPGAVVMSWWSFSTPLWYVQHVDGVRPDAEIFNGLASVVDEIPRRLEAGQPVYLVQPDEIVGRAVAAHDIALEPLMVCGVRVHAVVAERSTAGRTSPRH